MRIGILTSGNHRQGSFRLRADVPTRPLRALGHSVYVGPTVLPDRDVQIRTKLWSGDAKALQAAREAGQAVVFDLCDDHSHRPGWEEVVRPAVEMADVLTVGSPVIGALFHDRFGREAMLIEDAYEELPANPSFRPGKRLKALWYGHASNSAALEAIAPEIERRARLRAVCNVNLKGIDTTAWSPKAQEEALAWCDVVVIPVNTTLREDLPNGLAKTASRVVGALRRGKFVVAWPIASYQQFAKWIWLGDVIEGLDWLRDQPRAEIEGRIAEAQVYVRKTFSPLAIAGRWEAAATSAIDKRRATNALRVQT